MVLFLTKLIKLFAGFPAKLPLQTVLIVPFVLQISVAVSLTSYFSWRNGQKAVNDITTQLLTEISLRVEQNLLTFLNTPHQINQSNLNNIRLDRLDIQNFSELEKYFFYQLKEFDSLTLIGFANTKKEFISSERLHPDDSLTIRVSGKLTNYELRTYTTNAQGKRIKIIDYYTGKDYDPRRRPWYKIPIKTGKKSWSEIYPHIGGETLYLGASLPVYDKKGTLQGILLSNLNLLKIGNFLRSLNIGKTGQCFIIERSGDLVATSSNESPFTHALLPVKLPENKIKRLLATDSTNVKTKAAANYLKAKFNNFRSITSQEKLDFPIKGERQFIQVLPFKDKVGIDWLIVVVVPEKDFMEQININNRTTIILCIISLIVAIVFGILVLQWITQPVIALKKAAIALKNGEWENTLEINRSDELGELANSFNSMAHQLQTTFLSMQNLNKALSDSEINLKQFLEAVPVAISIHDMTGDIYFANRIAKQFLGAELLPKATSEELAEVYQVYQAGSDQLYPTLQLPIVRSLAGETVKVDNLELRNNNEIIPLEVFSTPIFDDTGKIIYAIAAFIDITPRKQAEKLLADYNQILKQQVAERTLELELEIEERKQIEETLREQKEILQQASILEERNRIAREIHDSLAQAFTGIIIHLGVASRLVTRDAVAAQEYINLAREVSRIGLAEARTSVQALRSYFLVNGNLCSGLNQIVAQKSLSTDTRIICRVEGAVYSLPLEVENNLLRIGQEALNNAIKHSRASIIQVELSYEKTQCVLRVKDNGEGFVIDDVSFANRFGILGMRERSAGIGAQLVINSQPGQGTDVIVSYRVFFAVFDR